MPDLRLFSYLPNPRLYKATIAARFSGAELEIVGDKPPNLVNWLWDFDARPLSGDDKQTFAQYGRQASVGFRDTLLYKTDDFLKAHPFGNVPAGFSNDGKVGVFESNSIMRAAARVGPNGESLLGRNALEQSRVDSFLDRSLVFARDLQRYLLAGDDMSAALHAEMAAELKGFAAGLDHALADNNFIVGDDITLADICCVCDLCQLTNEHGLAASFERLDLPFLVPTLGPYRNLSAYLRRLSEDDRFSVDLGRYFDRLLPAVSA